MSESEVRVSSTRADERADFYRKTTLGLAAAFGCAIAAIISYANYHKTPVISTASNKIARGLAWVMNVDLTEVDEDTERQIIAQREEFDQLLGQVDAALEDDPEAQARFRAITSGSVEPQGSIRRHQSTLASGSAITPLPDYRVTARRHPDLDLVVNKEKGVLDHFTMDEFELEKYDNEVKTRLICPDLPEGYIFEVSFDGSEYFSVEGTTFTTDNEAVYHNAKEFWILLIGPNFSQSKVSKVIK